MTIPDMLNDLLRCFSTVPPLEYRLIDKSRNDEQRLIYIVDLADGSRIVIKAYRGGDIKPELVESWARLADLVAQSGVLTCRFISRMDRDGNAVVHQGFVSWAETYMPQRDLDTAGMHYRDLPVEHLLIIGNMVGRMLSSSRETPIACAQRGPYSLFVDFEENYSHATMLFEKLAEMDGIDQQILRGLEDEYRARRDAIYQRLPHLPYGLLQGDLSSNNLLINDCGIPCGLIDYNIAGEDYFILYAIQEFVFLAFEVYDEERWDNEHLTCVEQRFEALLRGLLSCYALTEDEEEIIPLIYNIARPLRWDKVIITIRKAQQGQTAEANERLRWMLYELTRNYPKPRAKDIG